jgi:hypothetical protein
MNQCSPLLLLEDAVQWILEILKAESLKYTQKFDFCAKGI